MKTTLGWFLSVTLGLLMGIADSRSQTRHTYGELLGKTVVSNAVLSASAEYTNVLDAVSFDKVSPRFTPVHIYTCSSNKMVWRGSGTAYMDKGREWVLTAGHLFNANFAGTNLFFYSKIQEKFGRLYGIQKVFGSSSASVKRDKDFDQNVEMDVALAMHGPATPIEPFSTIVKQTQESNQLFALGNTNLLFTSLLRNKVYRPLAIGVNGTPGKVVSKFVIFDYKAIPGESGSGFLGNDGALYLLTGSTTDTGVANDLKKVGIHVTNGVSRALMITLTPE